MENTEVISEQEIQVVQTKVSSMETALAAINVTNQEELAAVADHVGNIAKMRKFIKQEMDKYIKPAKEIIATAQDKYKPYLEVCDRVEQGLKQKAQTFMLAEKKREEEEKAKIVADGRTKAETKIEKLEAVPEAQKTVKTGSSRLILKTVKNVRVTDEAKIPDEYYKPRELDMVKIKKVALAGVSIPGVEVYEESQMSR